MLIFFMHKKNLLFILLLLFPTFLTAKEPTLAILVNIVSNEAQEFKIGNYKFACTPYGVITLEELYRNSKKNSVCQKSIYKFYKKRTEKAFYVHTKFDVFQSYSLIFKNDKCLINISGEKTYSEFLLEEGLGIKIPIQLDKEYNHYFYTSQREAKAAKIGLWDSTIPKDCAASIYMKK